MSAPEQVPPEFWPEVEGLFLRILESAPEARAAAIDAIIADRPAHGREVRKLLTAHDAAGDLMTPMTAGASRVSAAAASITGTVVGNFRLIEQVGEGGMGAVYRAERVGGDFAQTAAVKVMGSRLGAGDAQRRFVTERRILASLQHPNIVAMLDGGVTATGQPYLAMEFVDGDPITTYCERHRLSIAERLRLFLQVCAAVRFAHQHLVVHRDLKPGNVFVTRDGVVKVLDFGIAKLLHSDGAPVDATGALVGPVTADYASPEQLRGGAVTTASDVYSLGVLLFEVLAGDRPYRTATRTLDDVLEMVTRETAARASVRAAAGLPYAPAKLAGDLDAIVARAMAKDVARRYASVDELSADLQRWLDGRPVLARPDSRAYVIGRFLRRHAAASAAAAIAVIAVVAGLGIAVWQASVARAERDRATAQMRTAQVTTDFLSSIFDAANPVSARGATVTARDLLDQGSARIGTALAGQPAAQVRLLLIMGSASERLGDPKRALELAEQALALARVDAATDPRALADSAMFMGRMLRRVSQTARAIAPLEEAVRLYEQEYGHLDSRLAEALRELSAARRGVDSTYDAAPLLERAIRIQEQLAPTSASLGRLLSNLGSFRLTRGDEAGAFAVLERSIAVYEKSNEPESWGVALPLLTLGDAMRDREQFARARELFERALVVDDETFGRVSTSSAYTLGRLGDLAVAERRFVDARPLLNEARDIYTRTEPKNPGARMVQTFTGRLHLAEGDAAGARSIFHDVTTIVEGIHGPDHTETATTLLDLASADLALGRTRDAQAALERALKIRRAVPTLDAGELVRPLTMLARVLPDPARARVLLEEAVSIARASLPATHSHRVKAEAALRALGAG